MKRHRKPQPRPSRSCWLCDRIGHRWVTRQRVRVDDMSTTYPVLLSHCARCGKPSPVQVRVGADTGFVDTEGVLL